MENNTEMLNIVSQKSPTGQVQVFLKDAKNYYLPLDKSIYDLSDPKIKDKFIKSVEKRVRTSNFYKAYIDYLKSTLKLDRCAIFGNVQSKKKGKTKIEMHHGPIFTLYDYVEIILNKELMVGDGTNCDTFSIAFLVLQLHSKHLVQTVMLSESVHKSMDNPSQAPFISLDKCYGDLYSFVLQYHEFFSNAQVMKLKKYFNTYAERMKEGLKMFEPIMTKYNITREI